MLFHWAAPKLKIFSSPAVDTFFWVISKNYFYGRSLTPVNVLSSDFGDKISKMTLQYNEIKLISQVVSNSGAM